MRTYTEVGKDYEQEAIDKAISQMEWETFREDNLPFSQGECLKVVIKECKIPFKGISKMSLHGVIKGTYGFYGLDVKYKNGQAQVYIVDNGCEACVVASDFIAN